MRSAARPSGSPRLSQLAVLRGADVFTRSRVTCPALLSHLREEPRTAKAAVRATGSSTRRDSLRASEWPWSSVHARLYGNEKQKNILSPWPVAEPWRLSRLTVAQGRIRKDPRCHKKKPAVRVGGIGQGKGGAIRVGKHDQESIASLTKREGYLERVKKSPAREVAAGLPRHIFSVFRTAMAG